MPSNTEREPLTTRLESGEDIHDVVRQTYELVKEWANSNAETRAYADKLADLGGLVAESIITRAYKDTDYELFAMVTPEELYDSIMKVTPSSPRLGVASTVAMLIGQREAINCVIDKSRLHSRSD